VCLPLSQSYLFSFYSDRAYGNTLRVWPILFLIWIELPTSGGIFFTKVRDTVSVVLAVVPLQLKLEAKVSFTEEA